jgi:HEAT repeat protein
MSLTKTCNKCFEEIKKEAMICKYCGNKFSDEDIINELFLLLKNESLSIRIKALKSLSILKPKDISVRLIEFLLDTKSDVLSEQDLIFLQSQYRDKIIELGDPSILPFIEAQLNDNVKLEIRLILIELCGVFGDASVIPKLINYLNKDWLKDVSRQSIIKIGVSAIPILNQYLPSASKIQKKIINEILVELNK